MLGASFLPARFRGDHGQAGPSNPGYINRWITPYLQTVSRSAFTHPIHTIVFVALLASTSYIGILEGSLLDHTSLAGNVAGGTDLVSLANGGRRLRLGTETSWKWQNENSELSEIGVVNVCIGVLKISRQFTNTQIVLSTFGTGNIGLSGFVIQRLSSDGSAAR